MVVSGGGGQRFSKGLQEKIASEWNEEPGKEERGKNEVCSSYTTMSAEAKHMSVDKIL